MVNKRLPRNVTEAATRIAFTLLLVLVLSRSAWADRPKVGLVLGGGGARGAAHVGVLKVIERERIPIDYIAGTSMGAIVGALYASGNSAAEIEEILRSIDWQLALTKGRVRHIRSPARRTTWSLRSRLRRDSTMVKSVFRPACCKASNLSCYCGACLQTWATSGISMICRYPFER